MKKVLLLGDSITEGIGSKKINYEDILKKRFRKYRIINYSLTGTTINYINSLLNNMSENAYRESRYFSWEKFESEISKIYNDYFAERKSNETKN